MNREIIGLVKPVKTGTEFLKSKPDRKKLKDAVKRIHMLRFAITKFFFENLSEKEFQDYIKSENELTEELALGGGRRLLARAVSKLSKHFIMKELAKHIIDSFQYQTALENYRIGEFEDRIVIEIMKCPEKIRFNKWAKKMAPNLVDKVCDWDFLADDQIKEYGVQQSIELTEKGCIFTLTPIMSDK